MTDRIRVLVVDDSAFARRAVRTVLERTDDIEVVDIARDGLEAIEKIGALAPDVVTLDLMMPTMDGLAVLAALPREGGPRVVAVSSSGADTEMGAAALAAGAIDLVEKPTTQASDRLYEMAEELVDRVRIAAKARARYVEAVPRVVERPAQPRVSARIDAVVIGASTGGPQALTRLLPMLPTEPAVVVLVVLHMPAGYIEALAARLDALCPAHVVEARDEMALVPGMIALAPAGAHLGIARATAGLRVALDHTRTPGELHQPSVDALFVSAAKLLGARALGVVLTGMGDDGLAGARALHDAGARVLTEAEESCVVYGMPRAIAEAGLADEVCSLDAIASRIAARL